MLDLIEIFSKGGPVMYLLLLTSVFTAAIGIERFRFYNYAESGGEDFLNSLIDRTDKQNIEGILNFCQSQKGSAATVAVSGIKAAILGNNVESALNISYVEEAVKLRARLNYLSMIVTLAPLLGLLGTIFGMIDAFNIFNLQAGQPLAITGGIGEALTATAAGLCVAIFSLIIHTYLSQRLDEILSELDRVSAVVLNIAEKKGLA
ncbi:MAG: MotA/TolQ/ExbB proton channel family protein [Selenomonadaceae bacterium]|nr:MotA/TolQ/ExbB proton channel family protein [Selenomonadaceae bacterium]